MQNMEKKNSRANFFYSIVILIIILIIFSTGCSEPAHQNSVTQIPTSVSIQPKFITGDIVAKTGSSTDLYFLILKYDSQTDKYERAFVNKKSDGSWFRSNDQSEIYDRSLMEKIYTAKIDHVSSLSLISIETETPIPVTIQTENIPATSIAMITVTSTTLSSALPAPSVMSFSDFALTRIKLCAVGGSNFQSGATVKFTRNGYPEIIAKDIEVVSGSEIQFNFPTFPCSILPGQFNIVVTNPDGQSGMLPNGFVVSGSPNDPSSFTIRKSRDPFGGCS
jgi:hypothetical protein